MNSFYKVHPSSSKKNIQIECLNPLNVQFTILIGLLGPPGVDHQIPSVTPPTLVTLLIKATPIIDADM